MARIKNRMDSSRSARSIHFIFFVPGIGAVALFEGRGDGRPGREIVDERMGEIGGRNFGEKIRFVSRDLRVFG